MMEVCRTKQTLEKYRWPTDKSQFSDILQCPDERDDIQRLSLFNPLGE